MAYKRLVILLEGNDDERFFKKIVKRASGIAHHEALICLYSTNSHSFTLKICLWL